MSGVGEWDEIDVLIVDGREVQAVRKILENRGCALPEAYRLFEERCEAVRSKTTGRDPGVSSKDDHATPPPLN
ncbi:hypothetical protein ACFO0M_21585 [Micromonospora mangrovi]|uniref:Uncharacterized protein n=2 Tax=Micromonospora TaxID=1873 RepID=A0AAU8HBQ3_9ACTN